MTETLEFLLRLTALMLVLLFVLPAIVYLVVRKGTKAYYDGRDDHACKNRRP